MAWLELDDDSNQPVFDALVGDGQIGAQLGWSVAGAGDVNNDGYADVVIGAPNWDETASGTGSANVNEGAAFLFLGPDFSVPQRLDPTDQDDANFGATVAAAGDVDGDLFGDFLVGAPGWDGDFSDQGKVYLYYGGTTGMSEFLAPWESNPSGRDDHYGLAVAAAGDVNGDGYADVVIGAPSATGINGVTRNQGRAYVFHGGASGLVTEAAWVQDEPSGQASEFGTSVGSAGDIDGDGYSDVIIGAPQWGDGSSERETLHEGRAYIFLGSAVVGLDEEPFWERDLTDEQDANFGTAVAGVGDTNHDGFADVVVTAPGWDGGSAGNVIANEGRAYVFDTHSVSGPTQSFLASAVGGFHPTDQVNATFGSSVSGVGDANGDGYSDVLIGAPLYDGEGGTDEGQGYLYLGGPSGLIPTTVVEVDSPIPIEQDHSSFGSAASAAGDVDGDGFGDIVIGAALTDETSEDAGQAFVFYGFADGVPFVPDYAVDPTDDVGSSFGHSVARAGDINADGYGDILVGAPQGLDESSSIVGSVAIFFGDSDELSDVPTWILYGAESGILYGWSVAGTGDVDGNGYADFVIGAPGSGTSGCAEVVLSNSDFQSSPVWTVCPDLGDADFGCAVAGAGDVNGDGFGDVLISACGYDAGATDEGLVYLFLGGGELSGEATDWNAVWMAQPTDQVGATFGSSLASAGDVNGDGFSDVIIGAPGFTGTAESEGRAYLYFGSLDGLGSDPAWEISPTSIEGARFGASVSAAGDLNGDGFGDVGVGAPGLLADSGTEGGVFFFYGSSTGLSSELQDETPADQDGAQFGAAVAGVGDVNGDGFDDAAAGAPYADYAEVDEGAALLGLGRATASTEGIDGVWQTDSDQAGALYGSSISPAGDVNGDGFADLIVSAPQYDGEGGIRDEGRVYVYYGGDRRSGAPRELSQFQGDGLIAIPVGGRVAGSTVVFSGLITQEGPVGGNLSLEVAVARLGESYSDSVISELVKAGDSPEVSLTLEPGAYRWHARVVYPVGTGHGQWVAFGGNSQAEADFRVLSSNGSLCAIAAQCASDICEDGICCDGVCGTCYSCEESGIGCRVIDYDDSCGVIDCSGLNTDCRSYESLEETNCGLVEAIWRCLPDNSSEHCTVYTDLDGNTCDDQNNCTAPDTCDDGVCVGAPVDCSDPDDCTEDICDPKTGACSSTPIPGCGDGGVDGGMDGGESESEAEAEAESEAESESESEAEAEAESEAESESEPALADQGEKSFLACDCDISQRPSSFPAFLWLLLSLVGLRAKRRR